MSFESDVATVRFDVKARAVVLTWKGPASDAAFKEALEAGLSMVKQRAAKRWVGDVRELGVLTQEDQAWVNTDWFPRLIGTGLTHMAVVMPRSALTKLSVGNIMRKVEGTSLTTCNVASPEEGLAWVVDPSSVGKAA